jgi:hypothetical protein
MAPRIEVVGVYLPSADRESLEAFIAQRCAIFSDFSAERFAEIEAEFRDSLNQAALVEVIVSNPDSSFQVGDFTQPDPNVNKEQWQVAWCETFLSPDGEARLECEPYTTPSLPSYRVAFYIHYWQASLGLSSSYGPLACPHPQALPPRLWRLAPYDTVD